MGWEMLYGVKIAIFDVMIYDDISALKAQLADSSRKLADLTASMVYEKPELIKPLLEVSWLDSEPLSQRASRVVCICCCEYPELLLAHVPQIIARLGRQKSEGSRRNFLKIFCDRDFKLRTRDQSILLNSCFDFLTGNYSIAVKVYSMEIIYKLSTYLPDIQRELYVILTENSADSSAGYRSRAHKILRRIDKHAFHRLKNGTDH